MAGDSLSVIALLVSLVALIVAFLQVIQQYASTAYDYRRCSRRTMGGWAKETKRRFIWSEIRFEITFVVPHIDLDLPQPEVGPRLTYNFKEASSVFPYEFSITDISSDPQYEDNLHQRPTEEFSKLPPFTELRKTIVNRLTSVTPVDYDLDIPRSSQSPAENEQSLLPRKEWFLSLNGAIPETACSWLRLLHDTQSTNLQYNIGAKRLLFDYLPREVTRPLASAERRAFLVILTTLGTQWKDRGADEKFIGRSPLNEIVITVADVPSVGPVYSYDRPFRYPYPKAFQLPGSLAGGWTHPFSSMFNRFYLGGDLYSPILTWSREEVHQSLLDHFRDPILAEHFSKRYELSRFNIGIGELIAGWASRQSMPRRRYRGNRFYTSFSAGSLGCTFGMPLLSAILCNDENMMIRHDIHGEPCVRILIKWIIVHYTSRLLKGFTSWVDTLFDCLNWAAKVPMTSNILFHRSNNWEIAQKCDGLIGGEDGSLDYEYNHNKYPIKGQDEHEPPRSRLKHLSSETALLRAYSKADSMFIQGPISGNSESWIRDAVLLTARAAVDAVEELAQDWPENMAQKAVINRILRGVLWTIHNGNAPGRDSLAEPRFRPQDDRSLECSLSSKWLDESGTVYIS